MTSTATELPMILAGVEVVAVERLSPSFVRVELGGAALADLGVAGPLLDQRFKLVFPNACGELPDVTGADESWFGSWLDRPAEERGHLRTYTIREQLGSGADTRIVVDIVLHLEPGATGPGAAWAATAAVGDRLVTLAPRAGAGFGGIEFDSSSAGPQPRLLLVGDETAVPAISGILRDLPPGSRGAAFLEVPVSGDVLDVVAPVGVEVVWLPRDGAPLGEKLHGAVLAHLGEADAAPVIETDEVDPDLWETPTYSSSGEALIEAAPGVDADLYAWIAGEAGVVTGLRRHLVRDRGIDRRQVAFMGYWRRGVAMRS
ncbi:siderophore-interacting protein [uncultured Nocardioides sp.]|uniref:FAD-binding 9, siderophore-interacting domain protein n=1 Tax=uncultured Nocardioides sp. TaxID=198441 RepID=A0A6J4NQQ8_9ACTN|nr:siderophore-interacting protein [uncultured Nocardioides sp.]CAA9394690.1 MAG: FAD-binding 9, siderophore-interacting domain protein [uncultured Nocardioides sp.]